MSRMCFALLEWQAFVVARAATICPRLMQACSHRDSEANIHKTHCIMCKWYIQGFTVQSSNDYCKDCAGQVRCTSNHHGLVGVRGQVEG